MVIGCSVGHARREPDEGNISCMPISRCAVILSEGLFWRRGFVAVS
jgi:hypothetical protein